MGTATVIMNVCDDVSRAGGRKGHDSQAGVDGGVGGTPADPGTASNAVDPADWPRRCASDADGAGQLAAAILQRVRDLGLPARWLAGDEVYGGHKLRRTARRRGFDYVLAVRSDHRVSTAVGRLTVTSLAACVFERTWMRIRTGHGLKADRH